jgi:hypothetical protein
VTSLTKLEGEINQRLRRAVESKQYAEVERLNAVAMRLAEIEAEIQAELEDMEALLNSSPVVQQPASVNRPTQIELEIAQGDINARFLRISKLRERRLIPSDGAPFTVVASYGDREVSFETSIDPTETRLTERTEVGRFYTLNGVCAGDRVLWEQLGDRKFRLSKIRNSDS